MKTDVYYTCSLVPPELIAACGCVPQRLTGTFRARRLWQTEGMCSFTQAWLETLLNKAENETFVAVFGTSCDQMRRAYDMYCDRCKQHAFLLNVPSTNSPNTLDYYRQELQRLQEFLCDESGEPFDQDRLRTMMFNSVQDDLLKDNHQLKIAVVGEAVSDLIYRALTDILEPSNIGVVLPATGDKLIERFLVFDKRLMPQDPLTALAKGYFQLPTIWKRPNDVFYRQVAEKIQTNNIAGIILFRYVFCDLWHNAAYELKKRLALPVLEIDLEGNAELSVPAISRIQSFSEIFAV